MPRTAKATPERSPKGCVRERISLELPQVQHQAVERYARGMNCTAAEAARRMVLTGMAAYGRDRNVMRHVVAEGAMGGQQIKLRLLPNEHAAVLEGAQQEMRKKADFVRLMALIGLAEYEAKLASS